MPIRMLQNIEGMKLKKHPVWDKQEKKTPQCCLIIESNSQEYCEGPVWSVSLK